MAKDMLIFLFCCTLIPLQNTNALTVAIGAITNPMTRTGREQKVAMQLAVEKFSNPTLQANFLELNTTDPSAASSYVQNLIQLGANAIIAGGTVPQVFVSGTVGEGAKVPVVSIASSPFLSGRFLIQMSYSETALVRCIANVVKSYKWPKVIAIYEDDIFGSVSSSVMLLSNALDAIGSEVEYWAKIPPADSTSDPRSTVRDELRKTMSKRSTVYIILRISETLAPILFEEAVSQGIMSKGYIWICGNDIIGLLDSVFAPSFISKYMQGLVGIVTYINETDPEYINFQSNFQQRYKTEYGKTGENSFDPSVYATRAYDVVHSISIAATKSETNNRTLVSNLVTSNFSGLSGLLRPTNGSLDEIERFSVFRILNIVGRSYWKMGIWVDGHGFYNNENEYMLHQDSSERLKSLVFWPGGPLTTPAGLRKLKVLIPTETIWHNFVEIENYNETTNYYSSVSGFCIDVFIATLNCLGYDLQYEFLLYKTTKYDDLVNQVHLGVVDIVVGDVTILADRSENVSFTKPYLPSGLAMLVPVKVDTKGWLPTRAFSFALWMCIGFLFLYYILLVWYHEHNTDGNLVKQLLASMWTVCHGIFLNLDRRISGYPTRIVIILWFFAAQVLLNSFTASLSSILVTQNLKPDVNMMKIGCDGGSFVRKYLTSVLDISNASIVDIPDASEYNEAFENGTITAAYLEVPYLRVFLSQYDNYTVYKETQMLGGFGFVLPKDSLLANDMSEAILKLGENGTLRQLEKKWFPVSLSNYAPPDGENNKTLGLSNYSYMFVISSLALITLVPWSVICRGRGEQVAPENREHVDEGRNGAQNIELIGHVRDGGHGGENVEIAVIPYNPADGPVMGGPDRQGRLQRAASFTAISRTGRFLVSFFSFGTQQVQNSDERSLLFNTKEQCDVSSSSDGSHQSGASTSVVQKNHTEKDFGGPQLRRRGVH